MIKKIIGDNIKRGARKISPLKHQDVIEFLWLYHYKFFFFEILIFFSSSIYFDPPQSQFIVQDSFIRQQFLYYVSYYITIFLS